ncbi:3-hydroxyisobutyrate dehydrogenase [Nocardioides sp. J9]|uniref:NAD(P)-dependent oxidoreductase n=1 Tax=Nocardioides sp. J9 TaxID=935844 RepID=UPI0011A5F3DA|nr:NAD(P)-dependent oxidoreductase [Nocardioides sp. J9]TWG98549.1 3-hydroxyisobutyrate dehydrogenase [Nocardioides sp. J9]
MDVSATASPRRRITFIGLGNMGAAMASRLVDAGHQVTVFDRRPEAAEPLVALGARSATSVSKAIVGAEVVMTSLPGPAQVEALVVGDSGLAAGMQPGSLFVDLSTNSPEVLEGLASALAERGIRCLEAPVSGGAQGARAGTLALLVGGDEGLLDEYSGLLDPLGTVIHVGGIGSGNVAKIVHNLVSLVSVPILAEGFTLGVKAGVKAPALLEVMLAGAYGQGQVLKTIIGKVIMSGDFSQMTFGLDLARKDVALATSLAEAIGVDMPLSKLAESMYVRALEEGLEDLKSVAVWALQEQAAGVVVRREGE